MRFHLIDRIVELEPGRRIKAVKALSLAEEYLADHFPRYPVMPGVLMIEAMVQAGAWLLRATRGFAPAVVVLRDVRNVVYGSFVEPGRVLEVEVTLDDPETAATGDGTTASTGGASEDAPALVKFRGTGKVEGQTAVKGRFTLAAYDLAGGDARRAELDTKLREAARGHFALLGGPAAAAATAPAGATASG